jgi:hypothetical protein
MAIKTQLRLNQLTASFGASAGQVNDNLANKAALADISVVDLSGSLSYLASSIRRIHGGADFSDQIAGEFSHAASTFTGKILVGGDTAVGDDAAIGYTAAEGIIITGQGSTNDVTIKNDADTLVMDIPTGTTIVNFAGAVNAASADVVGSLVAGKLEADGDTSAGDNAAIGYTAAEGIVITGQGSTSDVAIKNDADGLVMSVPTGTTTAAFEGAVNALSADIVGSLVAGKLEADGDTASGDNAAIGYTAAEGIIITGQGSTDDVTIKNDNDVKVISIPTGTTAVDFAGDITVGGGDVIVNAANDGNASLNLNADNADDNGDTWIASAVAASQVYALLNNISGAPVSHLTITPNATVTNSVVESAGNLRVGGNVIQASDGGSTMTLDTNDKVTFAGNLDHADSSWTIGSTMTTPANKITLGGGAAVEILGDLFVRGTEHIIDTDNLRIKDPVIAMGAGNIALNSNGGISIISGSSGPAASFAGGNADMVMGRVGVNTWGAGLLDTQSGSITSVAGMAMANMRVRHLELSGSANYLSFATDVKLVSAADFEVTANSIKPNANDAVAIGEAGVAFSDLFLAEGGVINWDSGDLTLTQTGDTLALGGGKLVSDVDVSSNTLTTSAAQNLAIMQGAGANVDIGAHDLRAATVTADGLTATRLVFAGANGVLSDDSDMTFATDTLTVTKLGAFEAAGAINFASQNMTLVDIDSGTIDAITSLTVANDVDIGNFKLTSKALEASDLTASRVVFAGANGLLADDSDMTFSGDTLTVTKLGAFEAAGAINFGNQAMTNVDINGGAIDGTIIGANTKADVSATDLILGANSGVVYLSGDGGAEKITCNGGNGVNIMAGGDITLKAAGADLAINANSDHAFSHFNRAGAGEAYLNFSTNDGSAITAGSGGFGFRNTGGTMQFKNSAGAWSSFGASAAASKKTTILTGSVGAGLRLGIDGGFDISGIAGASQSNMIDVFVNGQMMLSGGTYASITNDYAVDVLRGEALSDLRFNFILSDDDVVTVTVR